VRREFRYRDARHSGESSKSNEELEFEALTKKIPPLGAPVHLVFKPKLKKSGSGGGEQGERSPAKNQPKSVTPNIDGKAK